jgi:hypothetical protein
MIAEEILLLELRRKEANNKLGGPSFPWQQAGKSELKSSNFLLLHKTVGTNLIFNGIHL